MNANNGPDNNVYTVLALASAIALAIAVGYTWYRFSQVFGTWNPLG